MSLTVITVAHILTVILSNAKSLTQLASG